MCIIYNSRNAKIISFKTYLAGWLVGVPEILINTATLWVSYTFLSIHPSFDPIHLLLKILPCPCLWPVLGITDMVTIRVSPLLNKLTVYGRRHTNKVNKLENSDKSFTWGTR